MDAIIRNRLKYTEPNYSQDWQYTTNSTSTLVTKYIGTNTIVVTPNKIKRRPVVLQNSANTSSRSLNSPLVSLRATPTDLQAVSTWLTSVSPSSVVPPSLTCCIRDMIVFNDVPMFSGASRVASTMVAIYAK